MVPLYFLKKILSTLSRIIILHDATLDYLYVSFDTKSYIHDTTQLSRPKDSASNPATLNPTL